MKKITLFCLLFCLLATALSAAADAVWSPVDDYYSSAVCKDLERRIFMAAGEDGYAAAVNDPAEGKTAAVYPNGTEFIVEYLCGTGADLWGAIHQVRLPGKNKFTEIPAWEAVYISQKDLVRAFDTDAFAELHSDRIEPFDPDDFDPCAPHPFVIHSYPGSDVQLFEVTESALTNYYCFYFSEDHYLMTTERIYTDDNGVRWLEIELMKPFVRGWLNYDALTAADGD